MSNVKFNWVTGALTGVMGFSEFFLPGLDSTYNFYRDDCYTWNFHRGLLYTENSPGWTPVDLLRLDFHLSPERNKKFTGAHAGLTPVIKNSPGSTGVHLGGLSPGSVTK